MARHNADIPNKTRALVKIAVIAAAIVVMLALMFGIVQSDALDELKHALSLWSVVALVVIINLVSFICFVLLYAAYQWVRRDLGPRREDDIDL